MDEKILLLQDVDNVDNDEKDEVGTVVISDEDEDEDEDGFGGLVGNDTEPDDEKDDD